ncbi:MAG: DNA translocase FtsK [Gemmatimonadales bacterium]
MSDDARRRIGAIASLVLGLSLGIALLPIPGVGTVPAAIGEILWKAFGAGAIGFPLLGLGVAAAGFGWFERLDMKRTAMLVGGLAVLIPLFIGTLIDLGPASFDAPLREWALQARVVGLVPGFFSHGLSALLGRPIAALIAFGLTSALTILTVGWHPLQRLEKRTTPEPEFKPVKRVAEPKPLPVERAGDEERVDEGSVALRPAARKKPVKKPLPRSKPVAPGEPLDPNDRWTTELLHEAPAASGEAAKRGQLDELKGRLQESLATFKVPSTIVDYTSGPVVTQFYARLEAGVKLNRLVQLADDLALAMKARSIRVARVPGKDVVGVEVPNPKPEMVVVRQILESPEWEAEGWTIPIALGLDLEGRAVVADLAKMPHLLIAGATGTGKSVAINAIITSLIYNLQRREDLRLLMVDPKMVELSMYNALPHLRHPVVTNNHDAATVLKWAVNEMERRYVLLQTNGARNLADFNHKVEEGKPLKPIPRAKSTLSTISAEAESTAPEPPEPEVYNEGKLPLIVILVDELADLMMTVQGEVETPLARLAQKARAIGIHLILATQRPSVNVITGLIKANFPSRIAFRVASKVDSRTILDQNGAEALLGNGDMLFLPPGRNEPMRIQGAFISTEETERIMDWYQVRKAALDAAVAAGPIDYDIIAETRKLEAEAEGGGPSEGGDEDRDPLFREAAEACVQNQGGSTSLLQRKLRIGYGRAARIIDQLHYAGILGPPDGSKPREVLVAYDQLDEYAG